MSKWVTQIIIIKNSKQDVFQIKVNIRIGILQGEAVSSLWFCVALKSLLTALNTLKTCFVIITLNKKAKKL